MRANCTCHVGPGKFEGESALTFLAWDSVMSGCSDETTGGDGDSIDWMSGPFEFGEDQKLAARLYGYCVPCILKACESTAAGLAVWEDSQGFVWCRVTDSKEVYEALLAEARDVCGSGDEQ